MKNTSLLTYIATVVLSVEAALERSTGKKFSLLMWVAWGMVIVSVFLITAGCAVIYGPSYSCNTGQPSPHPALQPDYLQR
jgi:hypothetical protein